MIWPRERSFTQTALKWPISCMFSVMPSQFIGSGKLPATALITTCIRFFARMGSLMSFQMAWFCICFRATFLWACVYNLLPFTPSSFLPRFSGLCKCYLCRLLQTCRSRNSCCCWNIRRSRNWMMLHWRQLMKMILMMMVCWHVTCSRWCRWV